MTTTEFNEKYKDYLEEGFYGLVINSENVIKFLDKIFQDLIKIPGFRYSQIKLKMGYTRVYLESVSGTMIFLITDEIDRILKSE